MAHRLPTLFALAVAGGLALSAPAANASTYYFSQTGFDGGGSISGSFDATDANSDGWVSTSEVAAFNLSFSGDSNVADFSQGLAELYILEYKAGSQYLGDEIDGSLQEVIGTNWFGSTGFDYYSGMGAGGFGGAVSDIATGAISRSDELVTVPVPIPAAVWLFGSALTGLMGFSRHRKAAVA